MQTLITNIKGLLQVRKTNVDKVSGAEMARLPAIENAYLLLEDDQIAAFGTMADCPKINADKTIDANGKFVLPLVRQPYPYCLCRKSRTGVCRPHQRLTYEEIANRGGGILNSAKKLHETTEDEIYNQSKTRLEEVMALGRAR
jgi:imidazolonepropionase